MTCSAQKRLRSDSGAAKMVMIRGHSVSMAKKDTFMAKRQCTATTKSGERCKVAALTGEDTCFFHSPTHITKRHAAVSKGGRQTAARNAAELIERVTGVAVMPGEDSQVDINTLEDTKQYVLDRMTDLSIRSSGAGDISMRESKELRGWTVILLKIQELDGLGAADRIRHLEQLVSQLDGATRKLLPAPEEVEA